MNGIKTGILPCFLAFLSIFSSCGRYTRAKYEGDALYLLFKTSFTQPKAISFWQNPAEFLQESALADQNIISNLPPDDLVFQINRDVYISRLTYEDGGRGLAMYLSSSIDGFSTMLRGHLLFVRRYKVERILIAINGEPYLYTNILPYQQ
ncbi:MAG: hypothetical protein ACRC9L_01660 [Brevinema sp.]